MLKVNENFPSFKEFYVLEEGIGSSIIEKFKELKKEIMTKDLDGRPINTRKIKSLEQEILELLKALGRLNKDVFKRFSDMIIGDPLIMMNKKVAGLSIGFWLTAIAHLTAFYGAKSFHDTKGQRLERQGLGVVQQQNVNK
jgi:hypothetical protein